MKTKLVLFSLVVIFTSTACTNNSENLVSAPDEEENPNEEVSYASQVQPILNSNCTSCHGSNGGFQAGSYSAVMNSVGNNYGTSIVVPGNADASGLVDKIEPSPAHGSRMPIGGTLSQSQIQTIRRWIDEGAQNN